MVPVETDELRRDYELAAVQSVMVVAARFGGAVGWDATSRARLSCRERLGARCQWPFPPAPPGWERPRWEPTRRRSHSDVLCEGGRLPLDTPREPLDLTAAVTLSAPQPQPALGTVRDSGYAMTRALSCAVIM